jgi:7-carboxy-7-deazaguanine synthase
MNFKNLDILEKKDQCKFIIKNKEDYDYAKKIVNRYKLIEKTNVIFSPVYRTEVKRLINLILKDCLDVRLSIQLHKIIWGVKKRGV